eukprot:TRINITY_DN38797_c0_g1_i1.p1 TRINITY_DN38797_c0_g1~~TRINITY_DN38797_c0_g1_i1.p1  ORF type:complete len:338 (-),score=57.51 TRINITY_DN38797_c0_g1_i1:87-1100(-)
MAVHVEIGEEQTESGTTFYDICVKDCEKFWTVRRRYSDFVRLDRNLFGGASNEVDNQGKYPSQRLPLPPRGLLGVRHRLNLGAFNERRKVQLNEYLSSLTSQLKAVDGCPPLKDFLEETNEKDAPEQVTQTAESAGVASSAEAIHSRSASPGLAKLVNLPDFEDSDEDMDLVDALEGDSDSTSGRDELLTAMWRYAHQHPETAEVVKHCADLARSTTLFHNRSEDVFRSLRRRVLYAGRRSSRQHQRSLSRNDASGELTPIHRCDSETVDEEDSLDLAPIGAKRLVWEFLVLMAARRPFYRRQVCEVAQVLEARRQWTDVVREHSRLAKCKEEFLRE